MNSDIRAIFDSHWDKHQRDFKAKVNKFLEEKLSELKTKISISFSSELGRLMAQAPSNNPENTKVNEPFEVSFDGIKLTALQPTAFDPINKDWKKSIEDGNIGPDLSETRKSILTSIRNFYDQLQNMLSWNQTTSFQDNWSKLNYDLKKLERVFENPDVSRLNEGNFIGLVDFLNKAMGVLVRSNKNYPDESSFLFEAYKTFVIETSKNLKAIFNSKA